MATSKITNGSNLSQVCQTLRGNWGRNGDQIVTPWFTMALRDPSDANGDLNGFEEIVEGKLWIRIGVTGLGYQPGD